MTCLYRLFEEELLEMLAFLPKLIQSSLFSRSFCSGQIIPQPNSID
jgi:hypothetical protein